MKILKIALVNFIILLSCSKESINPKDSRFTNDTKVNTLTNLDGNYFSELDQKSKEYGIIVGGFVDNILKKDNEKVFDKSSKLVQYFTTKQFVHLDEVANIFEKELGIEMKTSKKYFRFLLENRNYLLDINNRKSLNDGIFYYAYTQRLKEKKIDSPNSLETRGLFTMLVHYLNGNCSLQIAAGVADTTLAIIGAGATSAGSGGLLTGLAIGAALGEYGDLLYTANKCIND
ncbi:MAG: hypothetical protein IPP42_14090 [Saprospiraceae bacterium]|nr:hypothetical protein [Saprospiraceae bacterium]